MTEEINLPREEEDDGVPTVTKYQEALAAFADAQADTGKVVKTGTNPHFKSRYVELASVIDATTEALHKHGLFVVQTPQIDKNDRFVLETLIVHRNGQAPARSIWPILVKDMNDPQKVGGAVTYARRYSLMALMNIAGEDDDGNAASIPAPIEPKDELLGILKAAEISPETFKARIRAEYKKESINALTLNEVKKEIAFYNKSGSPTPF